MLKEKILIVEDNKSLSKLIVKKMQASLDFDIVAAYSYEEARALIDEDNDYFVALLDLNLPDAPDGEVVDMVIAHKIPIIVLTGTMDQNIRESILKKDVIDYVLKGSMDDVHYIFALIERLHKNRGIKVLVVDDSMVQRSQLKNLLKEQMYTVLVAAHGEEALVFLEDNPDIKLVLTDYTMPVIDGLELSKIIRKSKNKNELPIIAMTASNEALISAQFLKIGVNDFITKPFSKEELLCRIHNSLDASEYIKKIEEMAHNDFLTGLFNYHYFREIMQTYCLEVKKTFAIALINIDNFKAINDKYGEKVGDEVMVVLAQILKINTKESDILAHFYGGKFCIALKDISHKNALEFFIKLCNTIAKSPLHLRHSLILPITVSIGVALSEEMGLDEMLHLSQSALKRAKENGKNKVEIA